MGNVPLLFPYYLLIEKGCGSVPKYVPGVFKAEFFEIRSYVFSVKHGSPLKDCFLMKHMVIGYPSVPFGDKPGILIPSSPIK
jgi:hypothetical protein